MRTAHYWKKAGEASAPSNVVVFDTETYHGPDVREGDRELQTLRVGCALAYRLDKGRRTREQRCTFRVPSDFWRFVRSRLDKKRPLWIVAHNVGYDMGVVGGWGVITSHTFGTLKSCVSNSLFYLKGFLDGLPVVIADTFNYYRCSLATIGKGMGYRKLRMPQPTACEARWEVYCRRDVDVCARALDNLIAFVRAEKLGPWQPSIAGLAFAAFRSRFMADRVLVHNDRNALRCEREAYYGGIVDTAFVGRVPADTIHEMDVCSMYPSVCREPVPVRLKSSSAKIGLQVVKKLMREFHVIADVTLESPDYPYPVRLKSGTYYPTGRFRTSLAMPELEHAVRYDRVKWIHFAAWYEAKPIFREYMEYFIGKKIAYSKEGNEAWSTICKYYGTNLYGKTGQETPVWREWDRDSMQELEEYHGLKRGSLSDYYKKPPTLYELEETCHVHGIEQPLQVRDYFGVVEVRVGENESRESVPAIAATITSYARQLLRSYQITAGAGHWFYSDTDSIWVDRIGLERLTDSGVVRQDELGFLSHKKEHAWMHVHGPKDYETDKVRRMKGVRVLATPTDDGGWSQLQFPSPIVQIRDGVAAGVVVRHVTKHLKRVIKRAKIGPDGSARPLVFPNERPER